MDAPAGRCVPREGKHSTHHLLQAEKLCHRAGIPFRLVPIPRQISSDCGMPLRFGAPYPSRVLSPVTQA
ncbi:MAG: DUF3343 domain-containing protein, partial [Clostridia bacterium]|nr:DUF3343 domain-containing protein [Clostridia bacterium]